MEELLNADEKKAFLSAIETAVNNDIIKCRERDAIINICMTSCAEELNWLLAEQERMAKYAKNFFWSKGEDSPI